MYCAWWCIQFPARAGFSFCHHMQTGSNPASYPVHIKSSFLMIKWSQNGTLAGTKVKNEWTCIRLFHYAFMAWWLTCREQLYICNITYRLWKSNWKLLISSCTPCNTTNAILEVMVWFPAVPRDFPVFHSVQTSSGAHPAPYLMDTGLLLQVMKPITHLNLMPRSRMV